MPSRQPFANENEWLADQIVEPQIAASGLNAISLAHLEQLLEGREGDRHFREQIEKRVEMSMQHTRERVAEGH